MVSEKEVEATYTTAHVTEETAGTLEKAIEETQNTLYLAKNVRRQHVILCKFNYNLIQVCTAPLVLTIGKHGQLTTAQSHCPPREHYAPAEIVALDNTIAYLLQPVETTDRTALRPTPP